MKGIPVERDSRLNQLQFKYVISVIFSKTYAHMNTLVGPLPGSGKGLTVLKSLKLKFHQLSTSEFRFCHVSKRQTFSVHTIPFPIACLPLTVSVDSCGTQYYFLTLFTAAFQLNLPLLTSFLSRSGCFWPKYQCLEQLPVTRQGRVGDMLHALSGTVPRRHQVLISGKQQSESRK